MPHTARTFGRPTQDIHDELGTIPDWQPSPREGTADWSVSTHYFASYSRRAAPSASREPGIEDGNLVVVANCIRPNRRLRSSPDQGGLTLILSHACGSHKEAWEPTISHLLCLMKDPDCPVYISEIWAIEPLHHGDSAIINGGPLIPADSMAWSVDIVEFIERRLPLVLNTSQGAYSAYLPRHDLTRRPNVIGIGHSIGATALVPAALHAPRAFSAIILIEPILSNPMANVHRPYMAVSAAAARRKATFHSEEELIQHFKQYPLSKHWDEEAISLFAKYAVHKKDDGLLHLKTRPEHEAKLSADRSSFQAARYSLPSLSVPVFFVYGKKSLLIPVWSRAETAAELPDARYQEVEGGHLIVQEKPLALAKCLHAYLLECYISALAERKAKL